MIYSFDSRLLRVVFSFGYGALEAGLLLLFLWPLLRSDKNRFGDRRAATGLCILLGAAVLGICTQTQGTMHMAVNIILHMAVVTGTVMGLLKIRPVKTLYIALVFTLCIDLAKTAVLDVFPFFHSIKNSLVPAEQALQTLTMLMIAALILLMLRKRVCRTRLKALNMQQTISVFLPVLPYLYVKAAQFRSFAVDQFDITAEGGMINFIMCLLALLMVMMIEQTLDAALEHEVAVRERLSMERQRMQIEEHQQKIEEINKLSHDMRNHLATISAMSGSPEIQAYIARLQPSLKPLSITHFSGCDVLDALLSQKMDECSRIDASLIPCIAAEAVEPLSRFQPADLCTIYGNLLDNAIEATSGLADGACREIVLRTNRRGNLLIIRTENSYEGERRMQTAATYATTKEDTAAHGYGLRNIREVARRLGGEMTIQNENKLFIVNVLMPVQETEVTS